MALLFLVVIGFLSNFNKEYVLIYLFFFSVLPKCALTQLALLFLAVIGFHGMLTIFRPYFMNVYVRM